jgi:hypothetical protein
VPRLLVAISAHGLGHLGQVAPICNALSSLRPDVSLIIWSALPSQVLRARITDDFVHIAHPCDLGLIMHDAMRVDVNASWAAYAEREAHWSSHLETACKLVLNVAPDLILSDIGDMPLAAAQRLGIRGLAMSSLNWADTARFYFDALPDSTPLLERITDIYDNATAALRLTPGMPMRGLTERILPPVGARSAHTKQALDAILEATGIDPLLMLRPRILIGMGGIETQLPYEQWPEQSAFTLLVANQTHLPDQGYPAQGIINADRLCEATNLVFTDLLGCCDAVICKPGYGTFVESALAGIPVLYVERDDWPEQEVLVVWLKENARCAKLTTEALQQGHFNEVFTSLLAQPAKSPIKKNGATIAAQEILRWLDR